MALVTLLPARVQILMLRLKLQGANVRSLGKEPQQQPCGPSKAIGIGHNTKLWLTHRTIGPAKD